MTRPSRAFRRERVFSLSAAGRKMVRRVTPLMSDAADALDEGRAVPKSVVSAATMEHAASCGEADKKSKQ